MTEKERGRMRGFEKNKESKEKEQTEKKEGKWNYMRKEDLKFQK